MIQDGTSWHLQRWSLGQKPSKRFYTRCKMLDFTHGPMQKEGRRELHDGTICPSKNIFVMTSRAKKGFSMFQHKERNSELSCVWALVLAQSLGGKGFEIAVEVAIATCPWRKRLGAKNSLEWSWSSMFSPETKVLQERALQIFFIEKVSRWSAHACWHTCGGIRVGAALNWLANLSFGYVPVRKTFRVHVHMLLLSDIQHGKDFELIRTLALWTRSRAKKPPSWWTHVYSGRHDDAAWKRFRCHWSTHLWTRSGETKMSSWVVLAQLLSKPMRKRLRANQKLHFAYKSFCKPCRSN